MKVGFHRPYDMDGPLSFTADHMRRVWRGFQANGIEPVNLGAAIKNTDADVLVIWGWKRGRMWKERNPHLNVLVAEHGYLTDFQGRGRRHWTSLGWNGLNGKASFHVEEDNGQRALRRFPYRERHMRPDGPVVLMGQVRNDASLLGTNMEQWYIDHVAELKRAYFNRDIFYRQHPQFSGVRWPIELPHTHAPYDDILREAHIISAYNSSSLVDAAQAGAPILCGDEGCMAAPLAWNKWTPATWLSRMAWTQWEPDEIETGAFWQFVKLGANAPAFTSLPA